MQKVIVMMSTYNGQRYVRSQIESILNQIDVDVKLIVRDDGSTDGTIDILREYENKDQLTWYSGDNLKPAKSFMDLVQKVPITTDYYAFSDQDDYWLPNKLITAIELISKYPSIEPTLYYGKPRLVDCELKSIQQVPTTYVSKTLKQSIVSSGCTGCTMCFNKALLLQLKSVEYTSHLMHDNWIHKVCAALDGNLIFDENQYILYRQHDNNVIGANNSFANRLRSHIKTLFFNQCYRSKAICDLVMAYGDRMSKENLYICNSIVNYHKGFNRFKVVRDPGFRLGDKRLDILFVGAVLLGVF